MQLRGWPSATFRGAYFVLMRIWNGGRRRVPPLRFSRFGFSLSDMKVSLCVNSVNPPCLLSNSSKKPLFFDVLEVTFRYLLVEAVKLCGEQSILTTETQRSTEGQR